MAIPLLGLIPKIVKTAGSILGVDSVKDVVDALQNNKLTPEQRVALDAAAKEFANEQRQLDLEELRTMMSENLAMIQSEDKFVKRARPFGLYTFYVCTVALVVATVFGAKVDPTAILTILAPLAGVGGTYVYRRSTEKLNGGGSE